MPQDITTILPPRTPIAIIRLDDLTDAVKLSRALLEGGFTTLEFTLTNKQANDVIKRVRQEFGERLTVGAGTVLDVQAVRDSVSAGAQFLVTPALLPDVIEAAKGMDVPVVCGAFSPTEILTAWRAGADLVKVFPASSVGPDYIKNVLGPLPDLRLVPTGGVDLESCAAFLAAGAYTIGVGNPLIKKDLIAQKNWNVLTDLAQQYVQACKGKAM